MAIFVVHKHHASRLHYDFRLEMAGVLRSWAVPKEPSDERGVKRLAIQVEDHALAYADFEGDIGEGSYGAGKVEIWDRGEYELVEQQDGFFRFVLHGRRMQGTWKLIRTNYRPGDNWLLAPSKDGRILEPPDRAPRAAPADADHGLAGEHGT
jgi:bifunctional non-homologous end joining protein LigD